MADAQIVNLSLGRIFRMGSRPTQPGDVADYERCRKIILDELDPAIPAFEFARVPQDVEPNYARDRLRGAAGDI